MPHSKRIPVSGPSITQLEIDYVTDAVTNAWYADANVYHTRFEQAFAEYIGCKYAIALPSCTSALHLSLAALGVGPGDEVIVPELTWIATSAPISYVGATPVFADVDELTWCLCPKSFERAITPKTKAVIPVDLYGGIGDMDAIQAIAHRHGISVIEDSAEALGTEYHGRKAGSFGDTGAFSFHGSKTLTTGEGGMLVTDHEDIYERALFLRDHGRAPGDTLFFNLETAYKYKMSSMQAALGLAQIERADELVARKREIFGWYLDELDKIEGVSLNHEPTGTRNSYWMVTILFDPELGIDKCDLVARLRTRGIDSRPFFHPLSSLPAYSGSPQAEAARHRNRTAYEISPRGINLPSALTLTRDDVRTVCAAIKAVLAEQAMIEHPISIAA